MEETRLIQQTSTEIVKTDGKESVDVQITQTTQIAGEQTIINDKTNSTSQDGREVSPQGRYVKLEERLGTGAYKEVWRAYDTNDGIEVAWNVVKLSRIPPTERKRIKTEVKLLKDIQHKNVIRYFNSWVNRDKEQIIFVTEIMSSGSLKDYLRKNTMVRWMAIKRWCVQILTGLAFLHENHIIHRDIKCDNIFINGATGDIRIGDLGLSTRITEARLPFNASTSGAGGGGGAEITASTMTCLGTPEFMAPEMYEEAYDERVDIYAFGMCMLEMVTGLLPYHNCASAVQIYRKVLNGELPPELELIEQSNLRAHSFVNACLLPKEKRPTATELLEHAFLQSREDEDLCEVRPKALRYLPIEEEGEEEGDDEEGDENNEHEEQRSSNVYSETEKPESEATTVVASVKEGAPSSLRNTPIDSATNTPVESISGKCALPTDIPSSASSSPLPNSTYTSTTPTPKNADIGDDIKIDADMIKALSRSRSTSNPPSATTTRVRRTVLTQAVDSSYQGSPRSARDKRRSSSVGSCDAVLPQTSPGYSMRSSWDRIVTTPAMNNSATCSNTATDDEVNSHANNNTGARRVTALEDAEGQHPHCHVLSEDSGSFPIDDQTAGTVTVFDIQDHDSLENTLVFYLRIRQHTADPTTTGTAGSSSSGCSSPSSHHNSNSNFPSNNTNDNTDTTDTTPINTDKQLEIEFEFDLVNDTIENITEEMLQLEDLQDRLDVSNATLITVLEPLIIYAKRALNKIQHQYSAYTTTSGSKEETETSLAVETVRLLLEAAEGQTANPAYRSLHRKTSSFTEQMNNQNTSGQIDHSNSTIDHSNGITGHSSGVVKQTKEGEGEESPKLTSPNLPDWLMRSGEYQVLYKEHTEYIERIQKEYYKRKSSLVTQSEKLQETQEKDRAALTKRRGDLMTQLDDMQMKFHDRMEDFNMRKTRILEIHLDTAALQQQQQYREESVNTDNTSMPSIEHSDHCYATSTGGTTAVTTTSCYSRGESNSTIGSTTTLHNGSHIPSEIAGLLN